MTAALAKDCHFTRLPGDRWGLAVYRPLRWGFAGTGKIAEDFVEILALVPGAQLAAAAARSKDRLPQAQAFADKHGINSTKVNRGVKSYSLVSHHCEWMQSIRGMAGQYHARFIWYTDLVCSAAVTSQAASLAEEKHNMQNSELGILTPV